MQQLYNYWGTIPAKTEIYTKHGKFWYEAKDGTLIYLNAEILLALEELSIGLAYKEAVISHNRFLIYTKEELPENLEENFTRIIEMLASTPASERNSLAKLVVLSNLRGLKFWAGSATMRGGYWARSRDCRSFTLEGLGFNYGSTRLNSLSKALGHYKFYYDKFKSV